MPDASLTERLAAKQISPEDLAQQAFKDPALLAAVVRGLSSSQPQARYGCAKAARLIASERPASLVSHADAFFRLLDSDNNILKWTAIDVLGCLAAQERSGDVTRLTQRLCRFLSCGNLITANHAIGALARIAVARNALRDEIAGELLKVEGYSFDTEECRNIALGKVVAALDMFVDDLSDKREAFAFVERQTSNTRNSTRKKADALLRKRGISSKPHRPD